MRKWSYIASFVFATATVLTLSADLGAVEVQIPATHWPSIYYESFDGVTNTMSMRPLRTIEARGFREIRVWISGPGYPQELWRFVETPVGWVGELVLYWDLRPLDRSAEGREWRRLIEADRERWCDAPRTMGSTRACYGDLPQAMDWAQVLFRLKADGIWELPDDSILPEPRVDVFGGWSLIVELHTGHAYRSYHYANPGRQRWPEAAQAEAIAAILHDIGPTPRYEVDGYGKKLDSQEGK